jgi:hypothetical protein
MLKYHGDISPSTPCPYPVPRIDVPCVGVSMTLFPYTAASYTGHINTGTGYGQGVDGDIST